MLEVLLRPELSSLIPYDPGQVPYGIKLDANESPFDIPETVRQQLSEYILMQPEIHRYPDSDSTALRQGLAEKWKVSPENIIVGNGSDQLIQLLISLFVGPGDRVVCPAPSFGMYALTTRITGGIPVEVGLEEDMGYAYNVDAILQAVHENHAKILFLCTPNNPTGGVLPLPDIHRMVRDCSNTLVVIDEAYGEFAGDSFIPWVGQYENAVVLRTFSKAYGLAGIRCGYSVSGAAAAKLINRIKPPYNVSTLTQKMACLLLAESTEVDARIHTICTERDRIAEQLANMPGIRVFPSQANFLLVRVPDAAMLYRRLLERGILIRSYGGSSLLAQCLRITIGTRQENEKLLQALNDILTFM